MSVCVCVRGECRVGGEGGAVRMEGETRDSSVGGRQGTS